MSLSLFIAACLVTTAAAQTTESNSGDERPLFILSKLKEKMLKFKTHDLNN